MLALHNSRSSTKADVRSDPHSLGESHLSGEVDIPRSSSGKTNDKLRRMKFYRIAWSDFV